MNKKYIHTSATDLANLRQKAKELIKLKPLKVQIPSSEAEILKSLYELEILKIELELQNEELKQTISSIESLKEREQTLKEYIDNSIDVIHTINTKGEFLYVSGAWEQYFGLSVSEAIGKKFVEFIVPEDREKCSEYVQRVLRTGDSEKSPIYRVKLINGSLRWIITNGKSYVDIHGNLIFIGVSHDITERIDAEVALRDSENRFRLSMDATTDGLWDWEIPTNKIYYSPGYFRMLGYEPNEYEHTFDTWKNLIHPDDVDSAISNNMDCLNNISQNIHVEFRMKAKDGSWRWILGRGKAVVRDANGLAVRMIGTHVDITQRKLAEENLFRKDTLLNLTGSTAKIGGWEFDVETSKMTWTEEVYKIHEVDYNFNLSIKNGPDFYAPDSQQLIKNAFLQAIEFGNPFDMELGFISAKGNHKWVHSIGIAIQDNGKTKKVYGSIQDITARKKVEEDLKTSEALYRTIINASPDQITIVDLNSKIEMFSPATLKMFGYNESDHLIGRLATDFLVPEDRPLAASHIALRHQGIKNGPNTYRAQRADGSIFYLDVNGEYIQNNGKKPTHMVFIGRDITDRKMAENLIELKNEELKRLNAEKDKFFSIISHDMRGPFNGFLGYTQILAKELSSLSKTEIEMIATGMNKSAASLFNLLENLLHWARFQQGQISYLPENIHLRRIIKNTIDLMQQSAVSKGIVISDEILDDLIAYGDPNMLKAIIRNLISNAVKFTPLGGRIFISAKINVDRMIQVAVKDSGLGISPVILQDLFRIDKKPNRKGTEGESSSGLGLILCKEFVEMHGGKIWVESSVTDQPDGIKKGSTFYFTMPKAK